MIKRMAIILLVCSLTAALAACGGVAPGNEPSENTAPAADPGNAPSEETAPAASAAALAYEQYSLVADKLSGEDYDIDFNVQMNMIYMGEAMDMDMTGNLKMKTVDGKVQYTMQMDMGELGSMEMYCDGDKAYYVVGGEVQEVDMAGLMDQISSTVNIPEFEKEALKDSMVSEDADGNLITKMVIDGKTLTDFIADVMATDISQLGEDSKIEISDIEMQITSDNAGNPMKMNMAMYMKFAVEGEIIEADIVYEYIFNKLGADVEIDLSPVAA